MNVTFDLINGLGFGIEYIGKNLEDGIDESAVVVTFAILRCIIWTGDFE